MLHKLNEDHCSACSYQGSLVYCDGCPRAYHLWCLDPPMEPSDVPEGDKWFCSCCSFRKVRISYQAAYVPTDRSVGCVEPTTETSFIIHVSSARPSSN